MPFQPPSHPPLLREAPPALPQFRQNSLKMIARPCCESRAPGSRHFRIRIMTRRTPWVFRKKRDVRFESLADIRERIGDVCFTPLSRLDSASHSNRAGSLRPAVSGVERTPGNAVAGFAQLLGPAKPPVNQS